MIDRSNASLAPSRRLQTVICLGAALILSMAGAAPCTAGADTGHSRGQALTLAFASFAPQNAEIFIQQDGGEAKVLAPHSALDFNPTLSPDNQWVVFTSNRTGSSDLYRVRTDGSRLERLTDHRSYDDQAAVAPDGRRVAFVSTRDGAANIWVLDLQNRKLRQLTRERAGSFRPAWSPDGKWIAFSSDRTSKGVKQNFVTLHSTELYVMRSDGSDTKRVTGSASFAGSPSWSPDGKSLAFHQASLKEVWGIASVLRLPSSTQISVIDLATGSQRPLTSGSGERFSPRWLADGSIRYWTWGETAGIGFTHGKVERKGLFQNASWSRDGSTMVFHRDVDTRWPPLQSWPSSDSRFKLIRSGIFPSFSPDGKELMFNTGRAGRDHNKIAKVKLDGSAASVVFADERMSALAPAWSAKANSIAFGYGGFFSQVAGAPKVTSRLAIARADGSGVRTVTPDGGIDGFPSWSPDGQQLVFRQGGGQRRGLAILDIGSGAVRPLTSGSGNDNFPAWSPDGKQIVFASDRSGDWEIYSIAPDGSNLRRLTTSPGNDAHPAWSPDGKWIAFSTARAGFKDEAVLHHYNPQSYGELAVMRPDGSDVTLLTDDPFEDATVAFRPTP